MNKAATASGCILSSDSCLLSSAAEGGAQGGRYLGRLAVAEDDDGHRAFNRGAAFGVEDSVVVADGGAPELADGEAQGEGGVEFDDAEEAAFEVDAGEVVRRAPRVVRPAEAAQQVALGLLDDLEDAREVEAPGGVRVGPAEAALELYRRWRHRVNMVGEG